MSKTQSQRGFGAIGVVVIILVIAVVAFAGWYVWNKNKKDDTKPTGQTAQNQNPPKPDEQKPADPSEGGKYLVISEWGVRFPLSDSLKGEVTYSLGDPVTDPDNNQIQAAKLLLKNDPVAGNECAVTQKPQGEFIDAAIQLLRVEKSKPFDTQRYKGTFKADVLADATNVFHVNYITPDCAGTPAVVKIEQMRASTTQLQKIQ